MVLALPMRLFWEYSGQVQRLQADEQRLQLQVGASIQTGGERVLEFQNALDQMAPEPVQMTAHALITARSVPDPNAGDQLRLLQG